MSKEITQCPSCKQDMEYFSTNFDHDTLLYMDEYLCLDCDEEAEIMSDEQESDVDPYDEIVSENCSNLPS